MDMDVTLVAGLTTMEVMVTIMDDVALEGPEDFGIVLTSTDPDVDVVNSTVTVTIQPDADSKVVCGELQLWSGQSVLIKGVASSQNYLSSGPP